MTDAPRIDEIPEANHQLAEKHRSVTMARGRQIPILEHLTDYTAGFAQMQQHFAEMAEGELLLPYAGEWLLDNYYVIQQSLQLIKEDMPPEYYRTLPKLNAPDFKGLPRVYALACALIDSAAGPLSVPDIIAFCDGYQRVTPLQIGEIWALPTMLRACLLERITKALYEVAELEFRLPEAAPPPAGTLAATDIVANGIRSLQVLSYQDWNAFFESVSLVEAELRTDPANVYTRMDRTTRNRYREAVERIARLTGRDEQVIAWKAVDLAQQGLAAITAAGRAGPGYCDYLAHVGYYLIDDGVPALEQFIGHEPTTRQRIRRWAVRQRTPLYLGMVITVTLALLLLMAAVIAQPGVSLLAVLAALVLTALPLSTAVIQLVDWGIMRVLPPRLLARLDMDDGVPDDLRAFVVIPALINKPADIDTLLETLEMHYLRNSDANLRFALLADFADAPRETMLEDEKLIARAGERLAALNARYAASQPFYFFLRRRRWNAKERLWIGWERKRGKLTMFNQLLLDPTATTDYNVQLGDLSVLPTIRYVITLDADTILPADSAQALIGTLAHPLNRAVYEADSPTIERGYTVLQPRVEILQIAAEQSLFTRLYAGDRGLDLYTLAVSNLYQDVFGDAIYMGKGIYDVAAFEHCLAGCVPENALLSHDLFEGAHGRVGLVTDIALIEDYPTHYLAHEQRVHRWIRGDWQLLPWLLRALDPRKNAGRKLAAINYWKIADNLRRSLVPAALVALFVCAWLGLLPGAQTTRTALLWSAFALLLTFSPFISAFLGHALAVLSSAPSRSLQQTISSDLARWALTVAFLLYEALLALDAIVTTLYRLVRQQHLLQWTAAAHINRMYDADDEDSLIWQRMLLVPVSAVAVLLAVIALRPHNLIAAAPLLIAWVLSPLLVRHISRRIVVAKAAFTAEDRRIMRGLARRTWLFFEDFVGPASHWLPPDHFRESPRARVMYSTSPTNIGLLLLTTLAANDLGYLGSQETALRLRLTFSTLDQLERYRGHFLNWYDTQTLQPLPPRYVSTVDSGNLIGCLIALRPGLKALADKPIVRAVRWQGLLDLLNLLDDLMQMMNAENSAEVNAIRAAVEAAAASPAQWPRLAAQLNETLLPQLGQAVVALLDAQKHQVTTAHLADARLLLSHLRQHVVSLQRDLDTLVPWLALVGQPPAAIPAGAAADSFARLLNTLATVPRLAHTQAVYHRARKLITGARRETRQDANISAWLNALVQALDDANAAASALRQELAELDGWMQTCIDDHDFRFLFDSERSLFHIGYSISSEQLDNSYYDLLASEARIASYIALAKGDIPHEHWLHLGRPMTAFRNSVTLLSWSGTMFEYLMPALLMRNYPNTLLYQSYITVTEQQIAYARERGMPWGVSESGYHVFDSSLNYQYRAFGIPQLAFKRGMELDQVIAPYASMLALPIKPKAVLENLTHLEQIGARGSYGLYEAVDYTPRHLSLGEEYAVVREYMAHHQGMIMVALDNALNDEIMVERFHSDPLVRSYDLLLQEKIPTHTVLRYPETERSEGAAPSTGYSATAPLWTVKGDTPHPYVHTLSNGRYSVIVTNTGGGYSQWADTGLTRFMPDAALDVWGNWVYLQDTSSGDYWSAGYAPTGRPGSSYTVHFFPHKVEFVRRDGDISLKMEVTVAPDDDVEIRRVVLTNHSAEARPLFLADYAEVILAPQETDQRHPAFNKLFIESEYLPEQQGLLFRRRPRASHEQPVFLFHRLIADTSGADDSPFTGALVYETDRKQFIGRGQTVHAPQVFNEHQGQLSGTVGSTLDPIMALGQRVMLAPYATAQLAFVTIVSDTRDQIDRLAAQYRSWNVVEQTFDLARYQSASELRQLNLETAQLAQIQRLFSALIYPHLAMRAPAQTLAANSKGQNGLWAYGISGDYPILLVRVNDADQIPLVQELVQAHTYWRNRRHKVTLVILNQHDAGYRQELYNQIHHLIVRMGSEMWLGRHDGIFLINREQLSTEADRVLLEASARVVLDGADGTLAQQMKRADTATTYLPLFRPTGRTHAEPSPPVARPAGWLFDNGLGGFSASSREYQIYIEAGAPTPAPWSNVIANPDFGFLVTETGGGFTWGGNSSEFRLTSWRNDAVSDQPAEALYLRDEETAAVWSPTPLPAPDGAPYLVRHGAGYSVFEHHSQGLEQTMTVYVAPDAPVKIVRLQVKNTWSHTRRITATYYAEWVLGTNRAITGPYLIPEYDSARQTLLVRNPYSLDFGGQYAFLSGSRPFFGFTTDRVEFLGWAGTLANPAALRRIGLASQVEVGRDTCGVVQYHLDIPAGETHEVVFTIGVGSTRAEALERAAQYQAQSEIERAWDDTRKLWARLLGQVTIDTPDPSLNVLLPWLLYQAIACRLWGRSAFYQPGGAFGFRDQLQDVMAVLHTAPELARDHILRAARHQFEAGDVLHWWHPPSGRGVRTRFSDDLIWLPYVVAHYVSVTGDTSVLAEEVPFVRGKPLEPDEDERYGQFDTSDETASIYEHCLRALEYGMTTGRHGLPLMGSGDWNDGMNRVGAKGQGESVWMGWFLFATLSAFSPICEQQGDADRAHAYRRYMDDLVAALEKHAWDGAWYLRAFYDDGTPLGSARSLECKIDSIAQSWGVISGAANSERAARAMQAVREQLVRADDRLILLFTPPFDDSPQDPGYIKGYVPGIRENGGQYTHAALWTIWAFALLQRPEEAARLLDIVNPVRHADTPDKVAIYQVEPYVVAADVYSVAPHTGRGGWTWYTGSAAWMYRLVLEMILGIQRRGDTLMINPVLPPAWDGFRAEYRFGEAVYKLDIQADDSADTPQIWLNGDRRAGHDIPLHDNQQVNSVVVRVGRAPEPRLLSEQGDSAS